MSINLEMLELNRGGERTMNPYTCDVVAFDECENRIVAFMNLHETVEACNRMCNRMNKMQKFWNKIDGMSVFSGRPIVWQFQDTGDPAWFDPKKSGLPVWGVSFPGGDAYMHRGLVRAVDSKLASRIFTAKVLAYGNVLPVRGATIETTYCYNNYDGEDHITTRGITWCGGPSKAERDPNV